MSKTGSRSILNKAITVLYSRLSNTMTLSISKNRSIQKHKNATFVLKLFLSVVTVSMKSSAKRSSDRLG